MFLFGDRMVKHWIDEKGRLVGRCTYCARIGRAESAEIAASISW